MRKKVLITGVNGFAGPYAAQALIHAGYEVAGTTHGNATEAVDGVGQIFTVDLRQLDDVAQVVDRVRPTHVLHLAAISFVGHGNVSDIYETNVVGTRNLLQALCTLERKPEAVLLTSSANVYGNSDERVLSEETEVNPANDYAVSKIAMEYMARQFADRLNFIIARPFNYIGRGQSLNFVVAKIVDHFVRRADTLELGNIDVERDFSDVRTVAAYFAKLLETPAAAGQVVNICSGKPCSLQTIIETCEAITGHRLTVEVNPQFVRVNEIKSLIGNPAKLQAICGRQPNYTVTETLEWMLRSTAAQNGLAAG